jgi:hypothetical protein
VMFWGYITKDRISILFYFSSFERLGQKSNTYANMITNILCFTLIIFWQLEGDHIRL